MVASFQQYKTLITTNRFQEFPIGIGSGMTMMEDFIDFANADLDLKIHLATVVLNRNFSSLDGHQVLMDPQWLIRQFLSEYKQHLAKPWISETIREAMEMIISPFTFTKCIIGTTFMFGVVEYYTKHFLGWRPYTANTFDHYHEPYRNMFIGDAITKLKKTNTLVARSLNRVDKLSVNRFKEWGIKEEGYIKPRIADRLTFFRNSMLHGENHNDHASGPYLCILYILFHYCDVKSEFTANNPLI